MEGLACQIFFYMRGHAAALLVQFEQSRHWGNLRRAFLTLPALYLWRAIRRLSGRRYEKDRFLKAEIHGFLSGLLFYCRTPRSRGRHGNTRYK